jgi:teichuronic acid biosynthesis glycosyltransferase TuaC
MFVRGKSRPPAPIDVKVRNSNPLRILTISCVFPNPAEPEYGVFVRARIHSMSSEAEIKVFAPIPLIDYSHLLKPRRRSPVPRQLQDGGIPVSYPRWLYIPWGVSLNSVLLFLQLLRPVARLRKHYQFEWIDAHFAFPDGIAAAMLSRWFGVPFSITLRGNETMHASRSRIIQGLMRWAFRRAASVITVSTPLEQFAISMGADSRTTRTIPNGVDHCIFYPRSREDCRRKLRLPLDARVIVSAGSLIERKGHHRVLEAVAGLRSRAVDAWLLVAGGTGREGDYSDTLRKMAAKLGLEDRVWFLGHVTPEALAEVMSAADLFCLASTREGWPNVVHEAMACGTPVVATDVGAIPDLIPSPRYGMVVPAGNQQALEIALETALCREWDREAIRRWAHARSWEQVADDVLQLLDSVTKSSMALGGVS